MRILLTIAFHIWLAQLALAGPIEDGAEAFRKNNYLKARQLWMPSALKGDSYAQFMLGWMADRGQGINGRDARSAAHWFQLSAKGGFPRAMSNLANLYQSGAGVPKDIPLALALYTKAANLGEVFAQTRLAGFHYVGDFVKQDYKQSFRWYSKAAQQENRYSQSMIGHMYLAGEGVSKDPRLAATYLEKAAKRGDRYAQYDLGTIYEAGLGRPKDLRLAAHWYLLAAAKGDTRAIKRSVVVLSQAKDPKDKSN